MRINNKIISPVVGIKTVRIAWKTVSGIMQWRIKKRNFRSHGGNKYGV